KRPRSLPMNHVWSIVVTKVTDKDKSSHTLFGVVHSGSRACLYLQQLPSKASITLLRFLLDTIEQYGKPKAIRTDNEPVFTSRLFRFGLWLLGIKHPRTDACCPWMNGAIERFFGTLNTSLQHSKL